MSETSNAGGMLTCLFTRLNRYADELPDDYKEQADPELTRAVAGSFSNHIQDYISTRSAPFEVIERNDTDPVCLEIRSEDGCEVEIEFYGDEAFHLTYVPPEFELTEDRNLRYRTTFTHLDRSGLVFLAHMLADEGRIVVPDAPESDEAPDEV